MGRFFERIYVVDPLPGEASLAVEILIHIGYRGRVRIDTGMSRVDRGKVGFVGARERHTDPRLDDPVPLGYASDLRIVVRAVERVRDRSDEQLRRISRQYRVRVECYDVTHEGEPARVADDRIERVSCSPPQEFVELGKLATLPLPAHPHILFRIPEPRTVKEKKHVFTGVSVPRVERIDARRSGGKNLLVIRPVLGW